MRGSHKLKWWVPKRSYGMVVVGGAVGGEGERGEGEREVGRTGNEGGSEGGGGAKRGRSEGEASEASEARQVAAFVCVKEQRRTCSRDTARLSGGLVAATQGQGTAGRARGRRPPPPAAAAADD